MSLFGCYLLACLPLAVAIGLWLTKHRFIWWEALVLGSSGFIVSTVFYYLVTASLYHDLETWSGQVTSTIYQPVWVEYYEYAVYRTETYTEEEEETDSKGNTHTVTVTKTRQVFDHWQPTTCTHGEEWHSDDTLIGNLGIDQGRYMDIRAHFGGKANPVPGDRSTGEHNSHMLSGDPSDYLTTNDTGYVYPVTTVKSWENRVKACPSVFSYPPVPPNVKVFDYPTNNDHFTSDRLLGAAGITGRAWDQLNANLGPSKKVNLIAVCFPADAGVDMGKSQESKWIGGKKNDLVITYGGGRPAHPSWVYVFGWTEKDIVKLRLQSLILEKGMSDVVLPEIQKEVAADYQIKDWHKFDYLQAEIPFSAYIWLIVLMAVVGGGWVWWALVNDIDKDETDPLYNEVHRRTRLSWE